MSTYRAAIAKAGSSEEVEKAHQTSVEERKRTEEGEVWQLCGAKGDL
jgi:hypothetical protein